MASKIEELPTQAADTATGAVVEAVEAVSDPVGTAGKQARRFERRGAPLNRALGRRVRTATEQAATTTVGLVDGTIPERLMILGLRAVKNQARRRDLLGEAAYRYLELVHNSLDRSAKTLARLEEASQPPARTDGRRTETPVRRAARRTASEAKTSARRTAARTASSGGSGASRVRRASSRTPRSA